GGGGHRRPVGVSAGQDHAADGQRRGQQGEALSAGDESNGETHRPEARRRATPWEPRLLRVGSRGRIRTFGRGSKVLCLTAWPPGIAEDFGSSTEGSNPS